MAHPGHRAADDLAELAAGPALDEALGVNVTAPSSVPDDQIYPDAGLAGNER